MKYIRIFTLIFFFSSFSYSQRNVKDSIISTPWVAVHYGGNFTGGDLGLKYGYLNHIGFLAGYKTNKNYFLGFDANFIFGNKVKASGLFDNLVDSYGNITDMNGDIAKVVVSARGFNANITFGKILPILSPNSNSGIFVHGGIGLLAHKLRIETQDQVVPSIELNYKKGYDRLTMGPNIHEFIGYSFLANRGVFNFYGGFYAQQGFTKNMRTVFFDQPDIPVSKKTMIDLQFGIRLGWFVPIYKRLPKEFYYN
ncbi:MAG: hypothetical protein HYR91_07795 [Flavobacteriia bacterium]|nr:hypothetical protein [Flavobacteriia bacterium]